MVEIRPGLPPEFRFRTVSATTGVRTGKHQIKLTPFRMPIQEAHIATFRKSVALQVRASVETLTNYLTAVSADDSLVMISIALAWNILPGP